LRSWSELDSVQRWEVILSAGLAVAFACYFAVIFLTNLDTEVNLYRWQNAEDLWSGNVPIMEYPPLALLFFAIPRIFADTPMGYNLFYVAETYVFTIVGLFLVRRIAERLGANQIRAMTAYAVLMLMFLQFVADRYDIFPAVLTIASFYFLLEKKYHWAFIILAVATLTKLYPAMFFPIFLVPLLLDKDWRGAFTGFALYAAVGAAVVGVCWAIDPELILNFLHYHSDRPLEIGCVAATLIYPFSMLGLTDTWILPATDPGSFGSDDLMGAVPDAVAPLLTPLMVGVVIACIAYYWLIRKHAGETDDRVVLILGAMICVMLAFMIFGKVFSSQYLIWVVPFFALIVAVSPDEQFDKRLLWLFIAMFALTQVNFAYIYGFLGGGTSINDIAMISMLVRNLMVIGAMVLVLKEMGRISRDYTGRLLPRIVKPHGERTGSLFISHTRMQFLDNMSFMDKAIYKTKSFTQNTQSKASESAATNKLNSQIKDEKKKVKDHFAMIGKEYYRYTGDQDKTHLDEMDRLVEEVNDSRKKIEELEAEIEEIKAKAEAEREESKRIAEERIRRRQELDAMEKEEDRARKAGYSTKSSSKPAEEEEDDDEDLF